MNLRKESPVLMKIFASALLFGSQLFGAHFITFQVPDCPGAGASAINNQGVVTGACGPGNGFIRDAHGHFTVFSAPGAVIIPTAINYSGTVTGIYSSNEPPPPPPPYVASKGFIRSADGAITVFNIPFSIEFASPNGINARGDIVGGYVGVVPAGFFRAADGAITAFCQRCTATAINEIGEIAGSSFTAFDTPHAVVLDSDGNIIRSAQPIGAYMSFGAGINRSGTVFGVFGVVAGMNIADQGFIQTAAGVTSVFPLPNPINFTEVSFGQPVSLVTGGGINDQGAVAVQSIYRAPDGTLTNIELGECANVFARGINDSGLVTGSCTVPGPNGPIAFGFLWRK
jgi:hypothetical protein